MSERDVIDIREYAVVLEAFFRYEPIWELFLYLDSLDIKKQVFVQAAHARMKESPEINGWLQEYRKELSDENYDNEESAMKAAEQAAELYISGEKGGADLKYSMGLWINHFDEMFDIIITVFKKVVIDNARPDNSLVDERMREVNALLNYLKQVYLDRFTDSRNSIESTNSEFDYRVLEWSLQNRTSGLNGYKSKVEYRFEQTMLSDCSREKVWHSFGFYRPADYVAKPGESARLNLKLLRRIATHA